MERPCRGRQRLQPSSLDLAFWATEPCVEVFWKASIEGKRIISCVDGYVSGLLLYAEDGTIVVKYGSDSQPICDV